MTFFIDENVKVFRFRGLIFERHDHPEMAEYRYQNPVPVHDSTGSLIGFGYLDGSSGSESLDALVEAKRDFPARLDIENGERYCLAPIFRIRGLGPVITILGLYLEPTQEEVRAVYVL